MPLLPTYDAMILANTPLNLWNVQLNPEILNHVRLHQSNLVSVEVLQNPKISPWVEHVPNNDNNANYHFRCKWCNAFLENDNRKDRKGSKYPSNLMIQDGMLHDSKNKNDNDLLRTIFIWMLSTMQRSVLDKVTKGSLA
ncbi:hypothetical protein Fcan01_27749 [Folsomia candida]|uniref:Uncharacterized protein n=1 Tax=Folsomia candida TaxID=158441 RepID=A0A226CVU1_FOLCA|nr:hypothetical protein Fcan01_27749 [Folsomia candida]